MFIQAKDLLYKYQFQDYDTNEKKEFIAVNKVNLNIEEGSFIAILGHNGSGKSTLAKNINALLKPTDGVVLVAGYDTKEDELTFKIRQSVGMVFQNPDNQIVAQIVEEDVAFGAENLGIPRLEILERVDFALNSVGMSTHRRATPALLSGGQKQRIAIAGILAMKPRCIIFDESTAMLDPKGRNEIMQVAKKLNKEDNITIVIITHHMEEALEAQRVVVMEDGNLVLDGTPREVFKEVERIRGLSLDVPPITLLSHKLKAEGLDIAEGIMTIDEMVEELCRISNKNV